MQLDHSIKKPVDHVYDYLTDAQKFVSVHPVIYKIEKLATNELLVYEKLKFLFIPIKFTYKATITGNRNLKTVVMRANVKGMAKIQMHFKLEDISGQTKIKETVEFKSFLPIKAIMQSVFKKQHVQLFQNIGKNK
ncbi:MAG: hypothetical protein Q8M29_07395 [Bacteroidota bacterium]|nr:hypothetical protein [Bacteroidota bacterium]